MEAQVQDPTTKAFEEALKVLESSEAPADTDAPSVQKYRLRPSEEAELLLEKFNNPTPPWGKKISLAKGVLGPEKCLLLGKKLLLNKTVTFLDLSTCDLQEAAPKFFEYVCGSNTLKHLSVSGNYINDAGAIAAAKSVAKLESLHLASNQITDIGMKAIATALRESHTIKALNVRGNLVTMKGLSELINSLENVKDKYSENLITLLGGNAEDKPNESEGAEARAVTFENQVSTEDQDVKREEQVEEEASAVSGAEATQFNEGLHTLWIQGNPGWNEELQEILNGILAKRVPQPPKAPAKAKKGKKKKTK